MIKCNMYRINEILDNSNIKIFDRSLISVHFDTIDSYVSSLRSQISSMKEVYSLADSKKEDIVSKCLYLNILMNKYYHKLTDEEIEEIKKEVSKCSTSSGPDLAPK